MKKINNADEFIKAINDESVFFPFDAENVDLSEVGEITNPHLEGSNVHNCNLNIIINLHYLNLIINTHFLRDCDIRGNKIKFADPQIDTEECSYNSYDMDSNKLLLTNVLLDQNQIEYLNSLILKNSNLYMADYETVINNKNLRISAANVIDIISRKIYNVHHSLSITGIMSKDEIREKVLRIEDFLNICNSPCIKELYNNIKDQLSDREKIKMFCERTIDGKTFHDLVINKEMYIALSYLNIFNCKFENVIFDVPTNFITHEHYSSEMYLTISEMSNSKFPNVHYKDWKDVKIKRVGLKTPITFRRNLYLELGRECNAKCSFCRNNCMKKEEYNLERIISQLDKKINLFDTIYIAGGEPTLKNDDVIKLIDRYKNRNITVVSNGTNKLQELYTKYGDLNYNLDYMISRHSHDDEENARIFGIPSSNFLSLYELINQNKKRILPLSLSCTCIKGGMDSAKKIIEYIEFASLLGITNIVFTNLHDDSSITLTENNKKNIDLNIDNNVFEEVIELLKINGIVETKYPIISSGGYELRTFKPKRGNHLNISFKRYLSKEELNKLWVNAVKRTFDLSMSPSGTIYDTWSQTNIDYKKKILKK